MTRSIEGILTARSAGKILPLGFRWLSHPARVLVLLCATQAGCASESSAPGDDRSDSGGAPSSGGQTGSGGDITLGGTGGTGGAGGTGGTGDSGGAPVDGSGGVLSTGGANSGGTVGGSGGDLGTGGDPGTGGAMGFEPCPPTGPCKILPLGDSITAGYPGQDSYRVKLFQLALQDGHDITFVGTRMAGPMTVDGANFPRNHEGVNGEKISQIAARVPSPALNDMPHIVLVHAGTNDLPNELAGAGERLEALVDELIVEAPDALIVVARIIPIFWAQSAVTTYNETIEPMVQEKVSAGAHVIVVDQFEGFPESDMDDAVHPTVGGYERMAQKWYDGIEPYLP